jgi:hypothetical protein
MRERERERKREKIVKFVYARSLYHTYCCLLLWPADVT